MIIDSSKYCGNGRVICIVEDGTTDACVWEHLAKRYGLHPGDGVIERKKSPPSHGFDNPETVTFIRVMNKAE
jgi:hypothetical protein